MIRDRNARTAIKVLAAHQTDMDGGCYCGEFDFRLDEGDIHASLTESHAEHVLEVLSKTHEVVLRSNIPEGMGAGGGVTGVDVEHLIKFYGRAHVMGASAPDVVTTASRTVEALQELAALVVAVERVQAQVDKALKILEEYDISEEEGFHQCATEDRWRLYRDLTAALKPEALETP
ncbi:MULTISPECIES: hypothetical protein [Rhodococcus]|uniref:hypothetical protein n=1 Tax=Rhodococcus TaxID=1827 RepID=UPI0007AE98AF|nr:MULTISPECIES: hypothetical protein [Rhodococcus]KZL33176.1 hypothetical protein A3852_12835 [Rhodococcus qingshengii]MCE4161666.1 hypothetical protein [Rhodococcus sp. Ni2]